MTVVLYDLVGRDDLRFSPHCWRVRMALAHKGVPFETRPVRFTEIGRIGDGSCRTVPALEDDGRLIVDSLAIAQHLEAAHPDRPSLFGGPAGVAYARFVQSWAASALHPGLITMIIADIFERLTPEDREYFRTTREKRFGRPLDEVQAGREGRVEDFRKALQPLRLTLEAQPFLGGEAPLHPDYVVFGAFQWARTTSPFALLAADDPLRAWVERCLDLFDGLARSVPAAA